MASRPDIPDDRQDVGSEPRLPAPCGLHASGSRRRLRPGRAGGLGRSLVAVLTAIGVGA
jgi:hypothetical protein